MSACSCSYSEEFIATERGPHVARKPGVACCYCGKTVDVGEKCLDYFYFFADSPGSGGHCRAHELCHRLRVHFADRVCGGIYTYSMWDFDEASQHAVAHGDDPYWRKWLLMYEEMWSRGVSDAE